MTEFKYSYHRDQNELRNVVGDDFEVFDAVVVDTYGMNTKGIIATYDEMKTRLSDESNSVMIFMYEDAIAAMKHIFKQTKTEAKMGNLRSKFSIYLNAGTRIPIKGKARLSSSISRVALVFSRQEPLMNAKASKNMSFEGDRVHPIKGSVLQKCIGGDLLMSMLYSFDYHEWENVAVLNFGRPVIDAFVRREPVSPSEKFNYTLHIADSNIRTISDERMECAVADVTCDFSLCPTAQQTTEIMKELESNGL